MAQAIPFSYFVGIITQITKTDYFLIYSTMPCTIGMAKEFSSHGIAFNSLWQERPITTQTLKTNFSKKITQGSNKPEVYAEAAYLISLKPSNEFTGNFCVDEDILRESGIDPAKYAVDPGAEPIKDIFLPGVDYDILNEAMLAYKPAQQSFPDDE